MATLNQINLYRGEDVNLDFTVDTTEDVAAWTVQFLVKPVKYSQSEYNAAAAVLTKTASLLSAPQKQFRVALAKADTSSLLSDDYYFQLTRTNSGSETVLAYGPLKLGPNIRLP